MHRSIIQTWPALGFMLALGSLSMNGKNAYADPTGAKSPTTMIEACGLLKANFLDLALQALPKQRPNTPVSLGRQQEVDAIRLQIPGAHTSSEAVDQRGRLRPADLLIISEQMQGLASDFVAREVYLYVIDRKGSIRLAKAQDSGNPRRHADLVADDAMSAPQAGLGGHVRLEIQADGRKVLQIDTQSPFSYQLKRYFPKLKDPLTELWIAYLKPAEGLHLQIEISDEP